ncbi:hypothetical protein Tco_0779385 [Tanacetum coccineum]
MDQDLVHMVAASKVPMLKPENGNALPLTKVVEGVETSIAPTTTEEKIQRRGHANKEGKEILKTLGRKLTLLRQLLLNALVSLMVSGLMIGIDQAEEGPTNFALMSYSSTSLTLKDLLIQRSNILIENEFESVEQDYLGLVVDCEEEDVPKAKIEKKTVKPSFAKIEFVKPKQQEKTARKTVNHVKQNRQNTHIPRGNRFLK